MLYYITMCQLTILYSFRLRLASHLYSVDSPVCFLSSSTIIGFLISDFITLHMLHAESYSIIVCKEETEGEITALRLVVCMPRKAMSKQACELGHNKQVRVAFY